MKLADAYAATTSGPSDGNTAFANITIDHATLVLNGTSIVASVVQTCDEPWYASAPEDKCAGLHHICHEPRGHGGNCKCFCGWVCTKDPCLGNCPFNVHAPGPRQQKGGCS